MRDELRARAALVFAAGGVLMALTLVLGVVLMVSSGPDGSPSALSAQVQPQPTRTPEPTATGTPTPQPAPERTCWDDAVVKGKETCRLDVEAAQFAAFDLDPATCRPGRASGHARWSYECPVRGVDVHVATYVAEDRAARLGTYGAPSDLGGGRILAGGPGTESGRWLRTYDNGWAAKGLLMYASVDGDPRSRAVLLGLTQRFPDVLLQGEPVVVD